MATATKADSIATLQFYPGRSALRRYFALWYFTILLVAWNILGHLFLQGLRISLG